MPRRSQRANRERYGVDSAGWNGGVLTVVTALPLGGIAPGVDSFVVNVAGDDGPIAGVTVTATSLDVGVATVDASAVTDAAGDATFADAWVAAGTTDFRVTFTGNPNPATLPVTVTAS